MRTVFSIAVWVCFIVLILSICCIVFAAFGWKWSFGAWLSGWFSACVYDIVRFKIVEKKATQDNKESAQHNHQQTQERHYACETCNQSLALCPGRGFPVLECGSYKA